MNLTLRLVTATLAFGMPLFVAGQTPSSSLSVHGPDKLTDSQVTDAILKSRLKGRHPVGLVLNDIQTSLISAMACSTCAQSGYTIHVYTPEQWIEQLAINAKREMLPFTADDVTSDMRVRMLHVVAMPSTPEYMNGNGFALASSVHRIVITDTTQNDIVQPVQLNNGTVQTNSALRSAEFSSANAAFLMSEVERLRALDGKGEFFITVTGSNQNKFFKVKQKFFKTLFN
jgi:hypothetical protein